MTISVNPTIPVITAPGATPALVLQPGTVVTAQVLQILANDLVQIAIADLSLDVMSQVPLQPGQTLQLAVSQMPDGVRLAIVAPGSGAATGGAAVAGAPSDAVTLAPSAPSLGNINNAPANAPVSAAPPVVALTPLERSAVSAAVQTAVTQQGSLAPLFANLGVVASSGGVPPALQQAVMQLLAQRPSLDPNLSGSDVQNAFEKSGLFLEASLASGSVSNVSGVPDLKGALIVLRQTLLSSLGESPEVAPSTSATSTAATPTPVTPATASPAGTVGLPEAEEGATLHAAIAPPLVPAASPEMLSPTSGIDLQEILPPEIEIVSSTALQEAGARVATAGVALNLLQEVARENLREIGSPSPSQIVPNDGYGDDVTVHTNTPPPPFRGASPSAQPVSLPSIASDATLATAARHLLDGADAAIARQTLMQVASLPGQVDTTAARLDPTVPNWLFEIPFATPQGTAVAQFEISRDGGGGEVAAAKRTWRARFSLDVEPAGPVHAMVSLSGDRTSVRMWAERPGTADQLRAGVSQLSQALTRAELLPGDIVIRTGTPLPSASAPAGHFLDRAL